jgi:hypothetical protein
MDFRRVSLLKAASGLMARCKLTQNATLQPWINHLRVLGADLEFKTPAVAATGNRQGYLPKSRFFRLPPAEAALLG